MNLPAKLFSSTDKQIYFKFYINIDHGSNSFAPQLIIFFIKFILFTVYGFVYNTIQ